MADYPKKYTTLDDCICHWESDKSLRIDIPDLEGEAFVPKSQIDMGRSEVRAKGQKGALVVSEWWWGEKQKEGPLPPFEPGKKQERKAEGSDDTPF